VLVGSSSIAVGPPRVHLRTAPPAALPELRQGDAPASAPPPPPPRASPGPNIAAGAVAAAAAGEDMTEQPTPSSTLPAAALPSLARARRCSVFARDGGDDDCETPSPSPSVPQQARSAPPVATAAAAAAVV